ncbi:MAG: hypothetical protein GAK28_04547 [Luteibacter sp.]|nr:MAG: hypothetical protein GAK28_04547 [Luteibacter sp.]
MIGLSILFGLAGFAALCLAMSRHQRDLLGRTLSPAVSRTARVIGWVALVASAACAMRAEGAALGAVYAFGIDTMCAAIVALGVTYRSR